jgi:hypothetical protein
MNTQTAIVPGSLSDLARVGNGSITETFIGCDVVILVDVSGSMSEADSRGGKRRYDVALEELAQLQASLPGKLAVIGFSNEVIFCPGGAPPFLAAQTDLAGALRFAKIADVPGMRFIVISDGLPDNTEEALRVAKTFVGRIDVVYVGPEDYPTGREFLAKLARRCNGATVTADRVKELATTVEHLLIAAS